MLVPLRVPGPVQPFAVGLLCYGLIIWHHDQIVRALACVAAVALLHTFAQSDRPAPMTIRRRPGKREPSPAAGRRLPDLPEG